MPSTTNDYVHPEELSHYQKLPEIKEGKTRWTTAILIQPHAMSPVA